MFKILLLHQNAKLKPEMELMGGRMRNFSFMQERTFNYSCLGVGNYWGRG